MEHIANASLGRQLKDKGERRATNRDNKMGLSLQRAVFHLKRFLYIVALSNLIARLGLSCRHTTDPRSFI